MSPMIARSDLRSTTRKTVRVRLAVAWCSFVSCLAFATHATQLSRSTGRYDDIPATEQLILVVPLLVVTLAAASATLVCDGASASAKWSSAALLVTLSFAMVYLYLSWGSY